MPALGSKALKKREAARHAALRRSTHVSSHGQGDRGDDGDGDGDGDFGADDDAEGFVTSPNPNPQPPPPPAAQSPRTVHRQTHQHTCARILSAQTRA